MLLNHVAGNKLKFSTMTRTVIESARSGSRTVRRPWLGARLQTVWREIDLSLSRSDPTDFNLDIEQMYWPPFTVSVAPVMKPSNSPFE